MIFWPRELRLAVRRLARRPGFTAAVVLTLGLGIGATVSVFAVVNAVLVRPLPYPDSERIVVLQHQAPGLGVPELEISEGLVRLYRAQARTVEHLAVAYRLDRNLTGGDQPARVSVVDVSPEFFDVVRSLPREGRRFQDEDVVPGAEPVAILTHAGWRSYFGGDPAIVGRTIEFDGTRTRIVGVMPEGFYYADPNAVALLPRRVDPNGSFGTFGLRGLARLAPGATLADAQREVAALQDRIPEMFPNITPAWLENAQWRAAVTPLRDLVVRDVEAVIWVVFGTAAFILLIACANVANLFLVWVEGRRREAAIRSSLGATRASLAAGRLAESAVLGLAGGALGVALAFLMARALAANGPAELPRLHEVSIDGPVLALAAAISVIVALAFGLLPAVSLRGRSIGTELRGGRTETGAPERHRVRKLLVVSQVAVALVLLTGSGLMFRSFQRLRAVDSGVRTEGVLTFGVSLGEYESAGVAAEFYQRVLDEIAALPGIAAAGASGSLPTVVEAMNGSSFRIRSRPQEEGEVPPIAMFTAATPGFFEAMGIPLIEGRAVERGDHEQGRRVVWVNQTFARDFLDGAAPGEWIQFQRDTAWLEIAGVVGDVRMFGLDEEVRPMAYLPMTSPTAGLDLALLYIAVRTSGDPLALFPSIRAAIARMAPQVPLTTARPLDRVLAESMARTSFTVVVLGTAALIALLLGAIGLYGVISYIVSRRTRELGIRIALGAVPARVRRLVVGQSLVAVAAGLLAGLAAAVALTWLMRSMLFEVSPWDPASFGAAALVLVVVSMLASYIPARRASATNPVEALRDE